eukprot:GHVR01092885.1.p1 GENE.GHVR01092885.1~~GHVR01092885.1.p1  ORF type:complete len:197 (+),score=11.26 GHVR01092885.1:357-947(+)
MMKMHCHKTPFECSKIAHELSQPGFRGGIDLKAAFFSLGVLERDQPYLGTVINGKYYVYQKMPMGLCCSPAYLDNRLLEVINFNRIGNAKVWAFMDDIAFWAPTEHEAVHAQQTLFKLLESHGFTINHDKCSVGKMCTFGKLTVTDEGVSITEAKLDDIEILLLFPCISCCIYIKIYVCNIYDTHIKIFVLYIYNI